MNVENTNKNNANGKGTLILTYGGVLLFKDCLNGGLSTELRQQLPTPAYKQLIRDGNGTDKQTSNRPTNFANDTETELKVKPTHLTNKRRIKTALTNG